MHGFRTIQIRRILRLALLPVEATGYRLAACMPSVLSAAKVLALQRRQMVRGSPGQL